MFLGFAEEIRLVPDGTILFHIALILLMVFALNRTLFRPINRILEERERRTRGRSGEAQEILQRVEEKLTTYERTLREARAESYSMLEQQRAEAMRERQSKLEQVREQLARSVEGERDAIRRQAGEAQAMLNEEARRVAAVVTAQILGRVAGNSPRPQA